MQAASHKNAIDWIAEEKRHQSDPVAPARGIIYGCGIGAGMWAAILWFIWG